MFQHYKQLVLSIQQGNKNLLGNHSKLTFLYLGRGNLQDIGGMPFKQLEDYRFRLDIE